MKYIIVCACFVIGCSGDDLASLGNTTVSEAGTAPISDGGKQESRGNQNGEAGRGDRLSDGGEAGSKTGDGETGTGIDGETGVPSDGGGEAGACHPSTTQVAAAPECAPAGGYTIPDHIEVVAIVSNGTGPANSCSWQTTPISCRCDYTCGCVAPSWPSTCTCRVVGGLVVVTCR